MSTQLQEKLKAALETEVVLRRCINGHNKTIAIQEAKIRDKNVTIDRLEQTNAALAADRKNLEAEVKRLQALLDIRVQPKMATPAGANEIARACNRRELEMSAHGLEERVTAKYWQDKYEELNRPSDLNDSEFKHERDELLAAVRAIAVVFGYKDYEFITAKSLPEVIKERLRIADNQVASLQKKLESARSSESLVSDMERSMSHWKDYAGKLESQLKESTSELQVHQRAEAIYERDIADLKAQLEGARARAMQEAEERDTTAGKVFSKSLNFRSFVHRLGDEILAINIGNGWDVTKPNDWPIGKGASDSENTQCLRKIGTNLALIHSEVSEALEAVRKLDRHNFEEELADVVIRVLDTSHGLGIDMGAVIASKLEKNRGRGHRHGGKAI